jgi:hypothetical protein
MRLKLDVGEHVITASDPKHAKLVATVSEQGITYVRSVVDRKNRLSLTVVEPAGNVVAGILSSKTISHIN